MALAPGTRLGRYEVRAKLAEGGMGEVYLAHDSDLDRNAALKILPPGLAADPERMRRFVREAKAAAALNHPNIAHIYEIGEAKGVHFIAMEFVDGENLREMLQRGRTELRTILRYLTQLAEALAQAHAAGVVHRDLKPENVAIARNGHAKVLDFGLAKLLGNPAQATDDPGDVKTVLASAPKSAPGLVMGTVGYMSPEQARGEPVDHRSDIFSFGCMLYEAAAGRRAFEGDSAVDTLHKVIYAPVAPVTEANPAAPTDLQRIIRRCLAKQPERRYQSIRDAANDLHDLLEELKDVAELDRPVSVDSAATRASPGNERQRMLPPGTDMRSAGRSAPFRRFAAAPRRRRIAFLTAIVLTASTLAGTAWYLLGKEHAAIDSLAVLPFVNRTPDPDTEYLSEGLAESLIYRLSQLPNLKVSPTSAVFRYGQGEVDPVKLRRDVRKGSGVRLARTGRERSERHLGLCHDLPALRHAAGRSTVHAVAAPHRPAVTVRHVASRLSAGITAPAVRRALLQCVRALV